jgi:3-oxoacyl-[acyl-carrier protein] reductase
VTAYITPRALRKNNSPPSRRHTGSTPPPAETGNRAEQVATTTGAHGIAADVASGQDNARTVATCQERMGGTAYGGSKWAVRGITQCWQAELRPHGIRVVCVCPSEVQTDFGGKTGRNNPNKLYADDIAAPIMAALEMSRRVLWPEFAVFANNPWTES